MPNISRIKEHMKVLGSDGRHVGTVDCVKEEKLILTKSDPASGGSHRGIPLDWVTEIDDEENAVRLDQTSEFAKQNWFKDVEGAGQAASKTVCP